MDFTFKKLRKFVSKNIIGVVLGGSAGYYANIMFTQQQEFAVMALTPLQEGVTFVAGGIESWIILCILIKMGAFIGGVIQQWMREGVK